MLSLWRRNREKGKEFVAGLSVPLLPEQVGYSDRFSFSKEFKRRYGYSPVQYRKRSNTAQQDTAAVKAQLFFDNGRYKQALSICEKVLQKADAKGNQDQVLYLKGCCLVALGRSEQALAAWNQLQESSYAWQAGMQCCRLYFQNKQFANALKELEQLWSRATGLQHSDVVQLWIEQVSALVVQRKANQVRNYLAFRKKHFVSDQQSKMIAVNACRGIGDNIAILDHCQDDDAVAFRAFQSAGRYDQILAPYGPRLGHVELAHILLNSGRYEELFALRPPEPIESANALVQLGRPEEAVERFPTCCASAYIKLGEHLKLLETADVPSSEHIYALQALGRTEDLYTYDSKGTWLWHLAQLYARPAFLLTVEFPETHEFIPHVRLLLAMKEGNRTEAVMDHINAVPAIDSDALWPASFGSTSLLLRHAIPAVMGMAPDFTHQLDVMMTEWRYFDRQILYHDAALLSGAIDLATWRKQPYQPYIELRSQFVQALHHDLNGRNKTAVQGYRQLLLDSTVCGMENMLRHRFAEWRVGLATEA